MSKRLITIWSTTGNNKTEIESSASTLGELQRDFAQYGVAFKNMSIVIGENNNSLESSAAQLLPGDMTLFFFPKKVKSGAADKAALLKTFSKSNKESKLKMAKKNGFKTIEDFKSFLQGKAKAPTAKKSEPKKVEVKKDLPKIRKADPKPTRKSISNEELQSMARRIGSTLPA